jgi:hypothetical protein
LTTPRKATKRRAPARARKPSPPARTRRAPAPKPQVIDVIDAPPPPLILPDPPAEGALPDVALSEPERVFAGRVPPPEPDRPHPSSRRAIFFDVENTSRVEHIARMIDHLAVDRSGRRTDFVAVGNWRVIGHDTARLLARHGADLVHSAPSVGVRDWSDLRIAVAAGVWLAAARPGDVVEIVSDDRAFDAVGDVAAGLGIAFRRLSYRGLSGATAVREAPLREPEREPVRESAAPGRSHRRGRGGRRGWRGGDRAPVPSAPPRHAPPPPRPVAAPVGVDTGEPHTAPHDEIVNVVRDLMNATPSRTVSIDTLANTLKARGFSRPPGSPRLITRLRRIKEIAISRAGLITLVGGATDLPDAVEAAEPAPRTVPPREPAPEPDRTDVRSDVMDDDDEPGPGNERPPETAEPADPDVPRRRRSRRGGRRHRSRRGGAPAATS